jgi:hypothetical protein
MFHQGDLSSGISLAIQQRKLVACFIPEPGQAESGLWEDEWLSELSDVVQEKAVLLRLEFGSTEAGFLAAFCRIEKAPTLVVIHNGQVLEQIEASVGHAEFVERLLKVMGVGGDEKHGVQEEAVEARPAETVPGTTQDAAASPQQTDIPALFPDRAARLSADQAARVAAEKAALRARQEARRMEAEAASSSKGKQRATSEDAAKQRARDQWIYQQKKRKEDAKQERERILARIEADKKERRVRAEEAKAAQETQQHGVSGLPDERVAAGKRTRGPGGMCALQIRLFDGSSIRGRFPSDSTLASGVRDWIKQQQSQPTAANGAGGAAQDVPYTFRHILRPQPGHPSRSIEVSEEHQTLEELELVPNATLVLVPVAGYTEAYSSSSGMLGWISSAYNSLPSLSYFLPGFTRNYLGGNTSADSETARSAPNPQSAEDAAAPGSNEPAASSSVGAARKAKVKTLADQRAERAKKTQDQGAEFYNGNSLGFEGRKGKDRNDDEDDEHGVGR